MSKFLQQVAEYYAGSGKDMHNMVMVFPNRRSAMFMRKYLKSALSDVSFMPRMVSITYFTQSFNDTVLASDDELIFILYRTYCDLLRRHNRENQIPTFDSFSFWGSILLNDFSEIDAYMVNPAEIFSNLKNVKEIASNYLTEEQIEAIELLWGHSAVPAGDIQRFWKHFPEDSDIDSLSDRFISLWMIMGELYDDFNRALAEASQPMAYTGLQSRVAAQRIAAMGADDFNGRRYVFIGFNVLSLARIKIFRHLKKLGLADFFWDTAAIDQYMPENGSGSKGRTVHDPMSAFIAPLAKEFPAPDDFVPQPIKGFPEIEIMAVPSNTAQAKIAGMILGKWQESMEGESEYTISERLLDTCVVLPDDKLLMPLLYSIPEQLRPINVTMGVRYTSTSFASLLSAITSMHLRARSLRGDCVYYYLDVQQVLRQPHIAAILPEEADKIQKDINKKHLFRISAKELIENYPATSFLFSPINNTGNVQEVRSYITRMIDVLARRLKEIAGTADYYELAILEGYRSIVDDICSLAENYHIEMDSDTFFRMLERELSRKTLNFVGKPLKGLQIMGVMDTRALDFDNVIMLSLNEGIFPQKNFTPSLIPATLRHGYFMPTQEQQESTYSYQFFRLLSRARKVRLLYDSRTKGLAAGEMSRYLSQLLHVHPDIPITFKTVGLPAGTPPPKSVTVDKTPEVVAELRRFRPGGDLFLSASALKTYLKCPLRFYLEYVKGIRVDNSIIEYIDPASYGTVIHAIAQDIYTGHEGETITAEFIDNVMKTVDFTAMAIEKLNKCYYHDTYTGRLAEIPGEGKIVARIISRYILLMLKKEKALTPFVFVGAEFGDRQKYSWRVNDKYTLNMRMSVDRIDRMADGALRFIDYKTGSDELEAPNVAALFSDIEKNGGIFQLLTYCHAYADIFDDETPIKPVIYKFQEIASKGIVDLRLRGMPVTDYRQADSPAEKDPDCFFDCFEALIDRIFEEDNAYPFVQCEDTDNCLYCDFKQMCGRYPQKKF